jgi:hypothetical protein
VIEGADGVQQNAYTYSNKDLERNGKCVVAVVGVSCRKLRVTGSYRLLAPVHEVEAFFELLLR